MLSSLDVVKCLSPYHYLKPTGALRHFSIYTHTPYQIEIAWGQAAVEVWERGVQLWRPLWAVEAGSLGIVGVLTYGVTHRRVPPSHNVLLSSLYQH